MEKSTPGYSIAHVANTPEHRQALLLAKSNYRGEKTFFTTWGHVVTKILDFGLEYTNIEGVKVPVFNDHRDVMGFFVIDSSKMGDLPPKAFVQEMVAHIYERQLERHDTAEFERREKHFGDILRGVFDFESASTPVITVLEKVGQLADRDAAFSEEKIQELRNDILCFAECGSFWADLDETGKGDYVISKKQMGIFLGNTLFVLIHSPEHRRLEDTVQPIKDVILALVQIPRTSLKGLPANHEEHFYRNRLSVYLPSCTTPQES